MVSASAALSRLNSFGEGPAVLVQPGVFRVAEPPGEFTFDGGDVPLHGEPRRLRAGQPPDEAGRRPVAGGALQPQQCRGRRRCVFTVD
jgi:hypothetical protein